jgi:hypothetical protein
MPFVLFRERRAHCEYWTCKPNSVEDDHSSRPAIAGGLKRPTRKFRASSRHACKLAPATSPLFGLAPCGVCHAPCITARPVRPYRTFSPLPAYFKGSAASCFALANRASATACAVRSPGSFHPAVFSLWHFPSTGLESGRPGVTWHIALWSSDFPLPSRLSPEKPA